VVKDRISLATAEGIAALAVTLFAPVCDRIEVAGSIRRRKPEVGDVEIVCVPKVELAPDPTSLLAEEVPVNRQFELAKSLRGSVLQDRLDVNDRPCFGPNWQRVVFEGFGLDVFACSAEQWGVTLAIRTGNPEFSKKLVMPQSQGGFLLSGQRVHGWRLHDRGQVMHTPEEIDFFRLIEKPWVRPEDRHG
jgi:DNA polymerase/3'-5' exonuclease PolX